MRRYELASALLLIIYFLVAIPRNLGTSFAPGIVFLLILSVLFHLGIEKPRWQMIPMYLLILAIFIDTVPNRLPPIEEWLIVPILIFLLFTMLLPALIPVPDVPKPRGSYEIGTMTFTLMDNSRREIYSNDSSEPRRFQIQIWYPAGPRQSDQRAPWMPEAGAIAPAISKYLHLPTFFLDHLNLVSSPAYLDAPLAEPSDQRREYPIILFSHGWNGFRAQSTGQMLELASHGYVVVGMQHTYGAITTIFPDGTQAPNNPSALPVGVPEPVYDVAARKLANQWAGDISFALDFMKSENQERKSRFYNRLDLNRVGVFGHSTGGGATIEFCGRDPRCKAGLTEDAYMTPVSEKVLEHGLTQPFFFIFSETFSDEKNLRLFARLFSHLGQRAQAVTIHGTAHYDFTDLPMLTPLARYLGLRGLINGERVTRIVDDYLLAFFNLTLNGQPSKLFDGPSSLYPEVKFTH